MLTITRNKPVQPANKIGYGNVLKSDKLLKTAAFAVIGSYEIYNDVKKASPTEKKNTFISDSIILASTFGTACLGVVAVDKFLKKAKPSILKSIKEDLFVAGAGMLGGITSGEIVQKIFPTKANRKLEEGFNLLQDVDFGTVGDSLNGVAATSLTGLDQTVNATLGFHVGREKGLRNKLLRATSEIVGGVIVPIVTCYPLTSAMQKQPTWLRFGVITTAAIASCKAGSMFGDWFNKNVTEKILRQELLDEIATRRKALMDYSINNVGKLDPEQRKKILENLDKLKNIKENFADFTEELGEKIKDKVEDIGDGIKDAGEKVEDVGEDFFKFKFLKKLFKKKKDDD